MSLFNNIFTRFCASGFGTGTTAGRAAGYTLLIVTFFAMAAIYLLYLIYTLVMKYLAAKKQPATPPSNP